MDACFNCSARASQAYAGGTLELPDVHEQSAEDFIRVYGVQQEMFLLRPSASKGESRQAGTMRIGSINSQSSKRLGFLLLVGSRCVQYFGDCNVLR